jgi:DNA-binding transcriptional ArsR family regulator
VSPLFTDIFEGVQSSDADVRDAVIAYLREHPRAMDSLEGIAQWWLLRQRVRVSVQLVSRALADLEESGLIERIREDGNAMYRLRAPADAAAGNGITEATREPPGAGGA